MSSIPVREMIKNAVEDLGGKASKNQIVQWISEKYDDVNHNTIRTQANACSVNQPSRIHLPECSKPRSFDPRYDFLFNTGDGQVELYKPEKHGNWELIEHEGKTTISKDGMPILKNKKMSLLDFLQNPRRTYANYQPIVIKTLLEKGKEENFSVPIKEMEEKIIRLNFDREDFRIKNAMDAVLPALQEYVEVNEDTASLMLDVLSYDEISECLNICNKEIAKWHVTDVMSDDNNIYFIQAGGNGDWIQEFQETKTAGVSYHEYANFDLTGMSKEEISGKTDGKAGTELYNISNMKKGDIVAITLGAKSGIENFGIVVSEYFFDSESKSYQHRVGVEYLNFGASEIDSESPKAIFKTNVLEKRIKDFLMGIEEHQYFMVRHNIGSVWDDLKGQKYHFGKTVPNQKKLRESGSGTKTIWYTKQNGRYYFWGYGTVKEIEVIEEGVDWNLVYDDFSFFEKETDSLEIEGQFLKPGNESIQNQIENVENFNVQNSIFRIPKKIYEDITGEKTTVSLVESKKNDYQKFFDILNKKKQFFFYGPPGTGKTFTAKNIAREFIKKSQTKLFSDEQYNEYVLSLVSNISREKGFEFKKQTDNQIILKNSQKEIRIYVNYSKSGKQTPHDCYVGISQSVIDFLNQSDVENRFVLIINNDVKNFVSIPHSFIIKNVKLSGGENWDSNGNGEHSFHIHVYDDKAYFRTNDDYSENYVDCSDFLSNIEILYDVHGKSCKPLENVTFHQSFSYEEFIEGIRPKTDEKINQVTYPIEDGIFKRLSKCASLHDKENFVLIIDEINRGNISKIFGELITLLENDKRGDEVTLPYSKKFFSIPENLYIIGTMNTADRSLVHIDAALKRRFGQYELMPDYSLLDAKIDKIHLGTLLKHINQKIINAGFRDNQIGHSYFMNDGNPITTKDELQFAFAYDIVPLLKDNFYDDDKILKDILGDEFIDENRNSISEWMEDVTIFMNTLESAYPETIE